LGRLFALLLACLSIFVLGAADGASCCCFANALEMTKALVFEASEGLQYDGVEFNFISNAKVEQCGCFACDCENGLSGVLFGKCTHFCIRYLQVL